MKTIYFLILFTPFSCVGMHRTLWQTVVRKCPKYIVASCLTTSRKPLDLQKACQYDFSLEACPEKNIKKFSECTALHKMLSRAAAYGKTGFGTYTEYSFNDQFKKHVRKIALMSGGNEKELMDDALRLLRVAEEAYTHRRIELERGTLIISSPKDLADQKDYNFTGLEKASLYDFSNVAFGVGDNGVRYHHCAYLHSLLLCVANGNSDGTYSEFLDTQLKELALRSGVNENEIKNDALHLIQKAKKQYVQRSTSNLPQEKNQ